VKFHHSNQCNNKTKLLVQMKKIKNFAFLDPATNRRTPHVGTGRRRGRFLLPHLQLVPAGRGRVQLVPTEASILWDALAHPGTHAGTQPFDLRQSADRRQRSRRNLRLVRRRLRLRGRHRLANAKPVDRLQHSDRRKCRAKQLLLR
jgi:hypothetical protein